ncbi:MAG TPA: SUMF1/EgtB/PvdO family nonheme iron enzyme [Firmicutes bacterium]|nr:SUMF1/EgtB/PvdO family nonheme iron enzyme [Bacillota bacterium]
MKRSLFIFLTAFSICTVIFSGCNGGNGNGGNGGSGVYYTLNVTVDPNGAGAVWLDPEGGTYQKNTEVTLKPAAEEGYEFSGWGGPNKDDVTAKFDRWIIIMDGNKQLVAVFTELKQNQVAAPTASPLGGRVAADNTGITLATTTDGATIYYTVDGAVPTTENAFVYSNDNKPVVPDGGMTLKAFAVKEGMLDSNIRTFVYTTLAVQPIESITHEVSGVSFNMRQAPAGLTFPFGMFDTETTIDYAYWLGETEVTYALWSEVYDWATAEERGEGRYYFQNKGQAGKDYSPEPDQTEPVTIISWRDAIVWCNALTEYYNAVNETNWACAYIDSVGKPIRDSRDANGDVCDDATASSTAKGFRLPASREWELAARYIDGIDWLPYNHASGDLSGPCYPPEQVTTTQIGDYVWYAANSGEQTHPVATKKSNPFGLFDMSGNVYEFCFDRHWKDQSMRVRRGGNIWSQTGGYNLLVSYEDWVEPDSAPAAYGFRFARTD